jgi:hypothetical protein
MADSPNQELMMFKSLVVLALVGTMSVPVAAQTQTAPSATNQNQQAQAPQQQMVKKRICEDNDNPSTTIHRVCHTVMVPAQPNGSAANHQTPAPSQPNNAD